MNIVTKFLTYQNQIKILHWQTTSYSEHKSLGSLYDDFSGHVDNFVEVFMGKYGRILSQKTFLISAENYKEKSPLDLMVEIESYLINDIPTMLDSKKDTDLLNLRDEMLASVNKTKYLLSLK